ncbi:MAG TPA: hypothetical protein VN764_14685 [Polyangiaceae bacterium]|nr:hypothetical protein [Polyangiaceae bacterium]
MTARGGQELDKFTLVTSGREAPGALAHKVRRLRKLAAGTGVGQTIVHARGT